MELLSPRPRQVPVLRPGEAHHHRAPAHHVVGVLVHMRAEVLHHHDPGEGSTIVDPATCVPEAYA